ncbi:MAG: CehA/McbA family metallohydrolase [Polyangiales bacterium]
MSILARALVAGLMLAVGACKAREPEMFQHGGVTVTVDPEHASRIVGGGLEAWVVIGGPVTDVPNAISSLHLEGAAPRGPIAIFARSDHAALAFAWPEVSMNDSVASTPPALHAIATHDSASHSLNIWPDLKEQAITATLQRDGSSSSTLELSFTVRLNGATVLLDTGTPLDGHDALTLRSSRYAIVDGTTPLIFAAKDGLAIGGGTDPGSLTVTAKPIDAQHTAMSIALARSMREAEGKAATLAGVTARSTIEIDLRAYDAATGAILPARVWVEPTLDDPTAPPIVWDPSRHAEPRTPLLDLDHGRALVSLSPGKYRLRATHGIGWSIEERTLTLVAGDAPRVAFWLRNEAPVGDYVGCDFHVHAEGSYDAREVTFEDRVRSLVAVGVGCAASTEHNAIGDFAPALKLRALEGAMLPIRGVEVTTNQPVFGHFNVFPWPGDARVPDTTTTTPELLFPAIHALPGDFVFQLNHPRMRAGGPKGTPIGYLDVSGYDVRRGVGTNAYSYRSDYDTIELFNGYQLDHLGEVHAMIDEWLAMIDRVINPELHVATGNSDAHWLSYPWAGFPRTFVATDGKPTTPASIARALKLGRAWVSSGPVVAIHVVDAKGGLRAIGDTASGASLKATIDVQLTSWCADPKLDLRLGVDPLSAPLVADASKPGHFTATVALPAVTRRRALVAIVDAGLAPVAEGMTGMQSTLAFTNPIWIAP